MKRPLFHIAIPLLLVFGLSSCVSLTHVHNYASSSLESVKKFEVINYSFEQACLENCQEKKITDFILSSQDCNCEAEERADSVTLLIYKAIRGYFDGLSNLSNNTLTNYKTNALSKSITELNVTSVQIDKDQAEAYSNISNILLRAFYDKYRKNKIREYLKAANEPILVLIKFLDFNLSANLTGKLNVQKAAVKDYYFDLTKVHEEVSAVDKFVNHKANSRTEFFIHADPCMPQCCHYCRMPDCPVRSEPKSLDIVWTTNNVTRNEKHFSHDV